MPSEHAADDTDRDDPEERLHQVWLEVRDDLGYEYLVDLHWDLCKEIVSRDEDDETSGTTDTDMDQ